MPKPAKMTENSKNVFYFLRDHEGEFTKHQISRESGIALSCVTGSVSGLIRKGYASERVEEVPNPDAGKNPIYVRYISLTESGRKFDPVIAEANQDREYQQQKIDKARVRLELKKDKLLKSFEEQKKQLDEIATATLERFAVSNTVEQQYEELAESQDHAIQYKNENENEKDGE